MRTHAQLCSYLAAKHPAIRRARLPFAGWEETGWTADKVQKQSATWMDKSAPQELKDMRDRIKQGNLNDASLRTLLDELPVAKAIRAPRGDVSHPGSRSCSFQSRTSKLKIMKR